MSTFVIHNVETGELLSVCVEVPTMSGYPLQVREVSVTYPVDFGKYEWVSSITDFIPRTLRLIAKLQYMNLFSDTELENIYTAAKVHVAVEVWLEKFKLASEIDLDDPRTIVGVHALETAGLLQPGRAAEVLGG